MIHDLRRQSWRRNHWPVGWDEHLIPDTRITEWLTTANCLNLPGILPYALNRNEWCHEFSNMEKGHLNISANEIGLRGSLDDLLGQFHEKYPNIMISLENMPSQESLKELSQGIMDFAFITSTVELHKPFRQVICKSFHDIPVIGSEFKIKNQSFQTLNDLQRVPYICMSKGHNTYDLYEEFFHDEGLRMNVDMFTNSFAMIMPMIEHGLGYAFMPDFIAEDSINTGKIFSPKIKEQMKPRNIRMIYDSTYPLSVAGKAFLDITLKYAKQHAMKAVRIYIQEQGKRDNEGYRRPAGRRRAANPA